MNLLVIGGGGREHACAGNCGLSAMLSEGVHSLVGTGNEGLLLYGMKGGERPPDDTHPLGYGRDVYFWSFVVALLIFTVGAGVSIYEGIDHVRTPHPIESPRTIFIVLGVSALFEGVSRVVRYREFRAKAGGRGFWAAFRASKDPPTFMVLFEDSAALAGLAVAAAGTGLALVTGDPNWDCVASLVIGAILASVAVLLAREIEGAADRRARRPGTQRGDRGARRDDPRHLGDNAVATVQPPTKSWPTSASSSPTR